MHIKRRYTTCNINIYICMYLYKLRQEYHQLLLCMIDSCLFSRSKIFLGNSLQIIEVINVDRFLNNLLDGPEEILKRIFTPFALNEVLRYELNCRVFFYLEHCLFYL